MKARLPTPPGGSRAATPAFGSQPAPGRPMTPPGGSRVAALVGPQPMVLKPATPSGGSRAASSSLSSQVITLHAKSQQALMSATARQVAALQETPNSETVLVVYSDNAARVFCEQNASQPKAHLQR